jgi:hypothetical protein
VTRFWYTLKFLNPNVSGQRPPILRKSPFLKMDGATPELKAVLLLGGIGMTNCNALVIAHTTFKMISL